MKEVINNIQIRQMNSGDVERVYELSSKCFIDPWSESSLRKELDNEVAYYSVAEVNGEIVSYAGIWAVAGEGEITNIAVDSRYRRSGIGRLVLKHLLDIATQKELSVIHLEVRDSNVAAQNLYKNIGFNKIAVRKNYYNKPTEDAIIMIYILKY